MRKHKTKFSLALLGLLSFFVISITFTSCEAEKEPVTDSKMIIRRCSMKDANFQTDLTLKNAVDYLKKVQYGVNSKVVFDERSGLYFNDEKGVYLSKDGKESYTFPVIRSSSEEKVENITFNKNNAGDYDIYIVKYDYTKEDLNNYTKKELAQREIKYQALLKNGVEYPVEAQWWICVTTTVTTTFIEDHPGEGPGGSDIALVCISISSSTDCLYGNDGGGGGGGGSGSGGGGGGGGGGGDGTNPVYPNPTNPDNENNQNSPILTAAIIDIGSENQNHKPDIPDSTVIQSLNELTNRPEVKDRMIQIKDQVSTVPMEQGSEFFTDQDNPINPFDKEDLTPAFSGIRFNAVEFESIVRLHSHHDPQLEPTFSGEDIAGMAKFYKSKRDMGADDAVNVTSILASNLGLHSLRVVNPEKAYLFSQRLGSSSLYVKQFLINYALKVQNKAKDDCSCTSNTPEYQLLLLHYLIQFLADQDTGLAIFSGEVNGDGSVSWTR